MSLTSMIVGIAIVSFTAFMELSVKEYEKEKAAFESENEE